MEELAACGVALADAGAQLEGCGVALADAGSQLEGCSGSLADAGAQLAACEWNLVASEANAVACLESLNDAGAQLTTCAASLDDAGTQLVACGQDLGSCDADRSACVDALTDAGAQLTVCETEVAAGQVELANCGAALTDAGTQLSKCEGALGICTATVCGTHAASQNTEFWFAPPDITDLHNSPGGEPIYLVLTSLGSASTVTISQPANSAFNGGTPRVVNIPAGGGARVDLTAYKAQLETRPTNTITNTGLRIQATTPINAAYEIANTNNTDLFGLKGADGLGTQFYIPLHKHAPFANEASFSAPHQAFASFDIVATQDGTQVSIYSPVPLDGHPALQQFTITLNAGQAYSAGWTGTNWTLPSTHPSGAIVQSDKPIAITLKDDSDHNPSGGCYDLLGDQIVPVNALGRDYIAVKGALNATGDESVVIIATQNDTKVYLDGAATPVVTLFAGEYYRVDMDYLATSTNNSVFVHASQPIYAAHISGYGCEMGYALLPPLDCGGAQQASAMRTDAQTFFVILVAPTSAVNAFSISSTGTATIPAAAFVAVPGTGGTWSAARIQFNTTQIPAASAFTVSNSASPFTMAVMTGGTTSGTRYAYFTSYGAPR